MASSDSFPSLAGVTVPSSALFEPALTYIREHTSLATVNHCIRAAYWALIIKSKLPHFASSEVNVETVVVGCILHDLGWATTKELLSKDKRFEVDGANLACEFITMHPELARETWDKHRLEVLWTAIALHTTPSLAHHHPAPEVALVQLGIMTDFFGPHLPLPVPGLISVDEYREVIKALPRQGFKENLIGIMCGLCRDKKQTTFDNFVSDFGKIYGLDEKGEGKEEWAKECEDNNLDKGIVEGIRCVCCL